MNLKKISPFLDSAMGVSLNAMDNHDSEIVKAFQTLCYVVQLRIQSVARQSDFLFKFAPEYKEYNKSLKTVFEFQSKVSFNCFVINHFRKLHTFYFKVIEMRRRILMEEENTSQEMTSDGVDVKRRKRAFLDTLLTATVDDKPLTLQDIMEEVSTFMFEV